MGSWQLFQGKQSSTLGTATQRTHPFQGLLRSTPRRILSRLKAGILKICPRVSAGQSPAFSELCLTQTNFSWTRKYGRSPEPFREHPVKIAWNTRKQPGIVRGVIPVPKWSFMPVGSATELTLTRKRPLTVGNIGVSRFFPPIRRYRKVSAKNSTREVLKCVQFCFHTEAHRLFMPDLTDGFDESHDDLIWKFLTKFETWKNNWKNKKGIRMKL